MDFKMNDKNIKLVYVFLLFLILFIVTTTFFNEEDEDKNEEVIELLVSNGDTIDQYRQKLETDILNMLSAMQGVGNVKVMITLENGVENIYVTEESFSSDISKDNNIILDERRTGEKSTLLVEDENGRRQALLKMTVEPAVRGVFVVCDGGDNILIVSRITDAIKALLNISSTKIYVTN